eukprot:jgi/Botrbrau1/15690/Bobra.4_1s0067.1
MSFRGAQLGPAAQLSSQSSQIPLLQQLPSQSSNFPYLPQEPSNASQLPLQHQLSAQSDQLIHQDIVPGSHGRSGSVRQELKRDPASGSWSRVHDPMGPPAAAPLPDMLFAQLPPAAQAAFQEALRRHLSSSVVSSQDECRGPFIRGPPDQPVSSSAPPSNHGAQQGSGYGSGEPAGAMVKPEVILGKSSPWPERLVPGDRAPRDAPAIAANSGTEAFAQGAPATPPLPQTALKGNSVNPIHSGASLRSQTTIRHSHMFPPDAELQGEQLSHNLPVPHQLGAAVASHERFEGTQGTLGSSAQSSRMQDGHSQNHQQSFGRWPPGLDQADHPLDGQPRAPFPQDWHRVEFPPIAWSELSRSQEHRRPQQMMPGSSTSSTPAPLPRQGSFPSNGPEAQGFRMERSGSVPGVPGSRLRTAQTLENKGRTIILSKEAEEFPHSGELSAALMGRNRQENGLAGEARAAGQKQRTDMCLQYNYPKAGPSAPVAAEGGPSMDPRPPDAAWGGNAGQESVYSPTQRGSARQGSLQYPPSKLTPRDASSVPVPTSTREAPGMPSRQGATVNWQAVKSNPSLIGQVQADTESGQARVMFPASSIGQGLLQSRLGPETRPQPYAHDDYAAGGRRHAGGEGLYPVQADRHVPSQEEWTNIYLSMEGTTGRAYSVPGSRQRGSPNQSPENVGVSGNLYSTRSLPPGQTSPSVPRPSPNSPVAPVPYGAPLAFRVPYGTTQGSPVPGQPLGRHVPGKAAGEPMGSTALQGTRSMSPTQWKGGTPQVSHDAMERPKGLPSLYETGPISVAQGPQGSFRDAEVNVPLAETNRTTSLSPSEVRSYYSLSPREFPSSHGEPRMPGNLYTAQTESSGQLQRGKGPQRPYVYPSMGESL